MSIYKADRTLEAIEQALVADQGNTYRRFLRQYMNNAEDVFRQEKDRHRGHLGASLIGQDCSRALWYTFRWTTVSKFDGKTLRLFNRGHMEEPRFLALLSMIGCEVWYADPEKKQYRVSGHRGHFGGGLDVVIRGLPEAPTYALLGEFKTHGDKSFKQLVAKGVRESKFQHYVQTNIYMGGYNLDAALYLAVNKNTDELYGEIIPFEESIFEQYSDRAGKIISTDYPPPKLSASPSWFQCKFCDHAKVCHYKESVDVNCRTCGWSQPGEEGVWECHHPKEKITARKLSKKDQLAACKDYTLAKVLSHED